MWLLAQTAPLSSTTPNEMHLNNRRNIYSLEILQARTIFDLDMDDPLVDKINSDFSSCITISVRYLALSILYKLCKGLAYCRFEISVQMDNKSSYRLLFCLEHKLSPKFMKNVSELHIDIQVLYFTDTFFSGMKKHTLLWFFFSDTRYFLLYIFITKN